MRLDRALVEQGLARSRTRARQLVELGRVRVDGVVVSRPAAEVGPQRLEVDDDDPWVSRAAHKLLGALDDLSVTVPERALDAGASTGGFTQVLLSRGCRLVHAVDVGHGQLDPALRADPRVRVHERLNLRELTLAHLDGEPVELVVADVSFISLTLLLPALAAVTRPDGRMLLMVKPQFEVGRERLGRGGVVRDPDLHRETVAAVAAAAADQGWEQQGLAPSRLPGADGNTEFFLLLHRP
ncbi:TlyA family RNA methyltransferase [Auraticoccus monumenti]|uniref:23S rRNA (Cytidine1920-2'-O)/16S rRNA (Cytidine1409-2'-O)-methyltransferase n=1 Tax=Auraticoccus monumenti TaxID=675864 RepID=A0A1G7CVU5_9ACTN|nr:TlyA family RNA methyltransferase [Auraticoccus monumenti]SDE43448.1 23S rRNA (cytidine1920-2'-O)/16S rRNA (cytidine1409-2'-O)-methyltransferase [Auraticoccus monumenti]